MTTQTDDSKPRHVPFGGFASDEDQARWLADRIEQRIRNCLFFAGINMTLTTVGLYELLLASLKDAGDRRMKG